MTDSARPLPRVLRRAGAPTSAPVGRLVGAAPPAVHAVAPLLRRHRRLHRALGRRWPAGGHPRRVLAGRRGVAPTPSTSCTAARCAPPSPAACWSPQPRASLAGAVAIGIVGIARVGAGLAVFIVVGVVLTLGYNLELLGGRLHNDVMFAAAWGAFPVLTAYYAQAETLRLPAVVAAAGAYALSAAQRSLSTPARTLRRSVASVDGTITYLDGRHAPLSTATLLAPLEAALKAMAFGLVALAVALTVLRLVDQ